MKHFCFLAIVFLFSGCLKLDSNLYNNDNAISGYLFDDYKGEQDFILDETFKIPAPLIHPFTLKSQTKTESQAVTIHAVYIGDLQKITTDTVILYCHGNKWHMDFYWQRAKLLAHTNGKNRYGVLMMDYRGYGLSEGEPTEEGMYTDVEVCLQWLKERGLTSERLITYGFSLGSAPACELTANPRSLTPKKLILEAPFASAAVMVQDASSLDMPAEYFTDLKIDNAEEIKKVSQPLLWIHGLNDNFLNYKTHGEVVFKNHGGRYKQQELIEQADHGEVPEKMGFTNYLETTGKFIRR
jgi:pimeloyl-ACP methyl ester carboxylesterase